jgi:hypothetical protein
MPSRNPRWPRRPIARRPPLQRVKPPRPGGKNPVGKGPKGPVQQGHNKPAPPGASVREKGRPANNTTCDIYISPNVPPSDPDTAGQPCALVARFQQGAEASEGDTELRWTHLLYLDAGVDVRDSYPNTPVNRVHVPDKDGTGFDVVFVETVNRGTPARYKRVFLDRRQPTWPTNEL